VLRLALLLPQLLLPVLPVALLLLLLLLLVLPVVVSCVAWPYPRALN